ncbi:hypothetical protein [Aquifex sp.]
MEEMTAGELLSILFILLFPWVILILYWKIQLKAVKKKYKKD